MNFHAYMKVLFFCIQCAYIGEGAAERRGGINDSVISEVSSVFKGKTVKMGMPNVTSE